ncbi:hypothetical protein [Stigmatella erecta]|uniref:Lipoprotein n=1 Tax=Stigmatella erecta TaxID=83460 RepID=A0A1I0ITN3_9BACT|nr:hypothetical protein [Stigmatella erecta]SET99900.1 hypothetical protein SAMN05443639_106238 [Stigmatella erecta]
MSRTSWTNRPLRVTAFLFLCIALPVCAPSRPQLYVPPEEAAWFKFPADLPAHADAQRIPGATAAAIQLAMDDFLPQDREPSRGENAQAICLQQRQSYDVAATPGPGKVMWITLMLSPGACTHGPGPLIDIGATYAVDTGTWSILAVRAP